MGNKTRLTKELGKIICDLVSRGNYPSSACEQVGVPNSTFFGWIKRGEATNEEPYYSFAKALRMAESISESNAISEIVESQDWRARAWYLERRFQDRWSQKANSEGSEALGLIEMLRDRLASHKRSELEESQARQGLEDSREGSEQTLNIIEDVERND
tara:strand:+ start:1205 stop:1678 length:474 start_codon:yes stop_codon:yes gene_type:complete